MKLTDLLSVDKCIEFEKEINRKFGMNAAVFNADGIRITSYKEWANRLCPAVKSTDKGQSFICAVAHMNMAEKARKSGKPVFEECDAGLLKLVVPIFTGDIFLGTAGGCGLLPEKGEVDVFAVAKITDMDENETKNLSQGIGFITQDKIMTLSELIQERISEELKTSN
ncbi:MAG: hypothetical protein GY795_29415 [Desulfobacterales bacterium]|nr:hypothetical protein [Desulfobacterales bacterium]